MSVTRNPNLGPSQMRQRRRRLFFIRFYIILFLLLVLIFSLAILSGHERVKIQTITVSGNAAVSADDIIAIAKRDMTSRYGYLFSKSNSLIFPRFKIEADLLKEIKTINEVNINWNNWQQISIVVTERKPHSVWCGADIKAIEPECFFVDKQGYIYSQAPVFSGPMFIKNYLEISTSTSPIGQYFLPPQKYLQIFSLIDLLDQKNINIVYFLFDGTDFRFGLDSGPEIIFNDKNKFELSFGNLFQALDTGTLDLVKDSINIKYIDLRFDNKIVVGKKT
jgi:hypothetical protein